MTVLSLLAGVREPVNVEPAAEPRLPDPARRSGVASGAASLFGIDESWNQARNREALEDTFAHLLEDENS